MTYFLGLTGGIATGKTTADDYFRKRKIPIIDADMVAHQLMQKGRKSYTAIVNNFGNSILDDHQEIDRKKLGQIVFTDPQQLARLNKITHPIIRQEIISQMDQFQKCGTKLVILDVPLLFESNYQKLCNSVLVVTTSPELQLQRLQARNNLNKSAAMRRIDSQMDLSKKEAMADFVVQNNTTINDLEEKLARVLDKIKN